MTHIHAGDLVIAVPIDECSIGHPAWHVGLDHPEMNRKSYIVTWAGFSEFGRRPMIGVAGRREHFCAGCFAKQKPAEPVAAERRIRIAEPV